MPDYSLSEIKLSHFRSHLNTRLLLDSRPVTIYGLNGVGKTNILEGISMLSPGRGIRRSKLMDMMRTPESLGWKISAVFNQGANTYKIETKSGPNSTRLVFIDDKPVSQITLGKLLKIIWLTPLMDRLWVEGAEMRRKFLDRITHSFIPEHAETILKYEKAMKERNSLLKEFIRDPDWYSAIETQMAIAGKKITDNRFFVIHKLMESMEKSNSYFPSADLSLTNNKTDFMSMTVDEFKVLLKNSRSEDFYSLRTSVGPHKTDLVVKYKTKNIEAKNCSTGEQKALLISLILANARALNSEYNISPIILLDEVSAHLDDRRRGDLYTEIKALDAQVWMTGTDLGLFDGIKENAQKFEVIDNNGISQVLKH